MPTPTATRRTASRSIWPYRDWVIRAFNRDLPFDRFTIEQIAGDLLPNVTLDQRIATGFHRNTMANTEGGIDDEEFRVAAVVDRVNTTTAGLDGNDDRLCPVPRPQVRPVYSQKEYFQLFAFFNNTADRGGSRRRSLPVAGVEQTAKQTVIHAELARLQAKLEQATKEGTSAQVNRSRHRSPP